MRVRERLRFDSPAYRKKNDLDASRHVQKNVWVITLKVLWKSVTEVDNNTFLNVKMLYVKSFTLLTLLSHYS